MSDRSERTGLGLAGALAAARDLPDGGAKVAELERIAAHADATGGIRFGVDARFELIDTYLHHGERWQLFEPLRRCLASVDRAPGLFDARDTGLLRRYQRLAIDALLGTPRVGLDQALSMLDDLACRLEADGGGPAVIAQLRCRIADHLGDEPTARELFDRWRAADPGPAGDCPGCTPAGQAELLAGWGEWTEALRVVGPVLDGEVNCTEQPERALAVALLPYLRLRDAERAAQAHVRAYRRHGREHRAFPYLATHLRFCALGGYLSRGLDILAEQLARLDRPYDEMSAMEFAAAGALLCRLAVEAGLDSRTIHRPAYGERAAADLTVAALGIDLLAVATDLSGRFDARNGTGHHSGRMASWLAQRPLAAPVPLPADESPDDDGPDGFTEPEETESVEQEAVEQELAPLSVAMIAGVLDRRGDVHAVDATGAVMGRWGEAVIQFRQAGERGEILHARVVATRRLPADRLAEAYEFCNAWNHDRLLPKAYVHDLDNGELVLAGDVTTDLEQGVAPAQLVVLVNATVATGAAYADAVAALP